MVIPMLMKDWTPNQIAIPDATSRPNISSARAAIRIARTSTMASSATMVMAPTKPSSSPATEKMKSVCCSGTKLPAQLPVEQALAEHPARADRDLGLGGAVAGAQRVGGWVDERGEPPHLVRLEHMQAPHGQPGERTGHAQRHEPPQPHAGHDDDAHQQHQQQDDDPQV